LIARQQSQRQKLFIFADNLKTVDSTKFLLEHTGVGSLGKTFIFSRSETKGESGKRIAKDIICIQTKKNALIERTPSSNRLLAAKNIFEILVTAQTDLSGRIGPGIDRGS
jgi:hypothetical protein